MRLVSSQRVFTSHTIEIEVELVYVSGKIFDGSVCTVNASDTLGLEELNRVQKAWEASSTRALTGNRVATRRIPYSCKEVLSPDAGYRYQFNFAVQSKKPSSLIRTRFYRQISYVPASSEDRVYDNAATKYKLTWHAARSSRDVKDAVHSHRH